MAITVLTLASCATGGADLSLADQYERTIPICVNDTDCARKMATARSWVVNNTGYALHIDNDEIIETGGWGRSDITAVRVERTSRSAGQDWILVELNCAAESGTDRFGTNACPPYWETKIDFNVVVSSAAQ